MSKLYFDEINQGNSKSCKNKRFHQLAEYGDLKAGNPEPEYNKTKHNVGKVYMNYFREEQRLHFSKSYKKNCEYFVYNNKNNKNIVFLKANSYMNVSGGPVNYALNCLKLNANNLIVACDDLETQVGSVKFSNEANPKGHNGVKSINQVLNNNKYPIIRIGISRPASREPEVVAEYVLKPFTLSDSEKVKEAFLKINEYVNSI